MPGTRRLKVEIKGAVQGVGFRPHVCRLARELHLRGWVANERRRLFIEAEGEETLLHRFLARLATEKPSRGTIDALAADWLEPRGYERFEIRPGEPAGAQGGIVPPDLATCEDCLAEVFDPADRRHLYPFTSCASCGPRFTIIEELPYDRAHTTMRGFPMCRRCAAEYENPLDRRFHARPNACPDCGPRLALLDASGAGLVEGHAALQRAARALRAGRVVAVKGLGGFHLMADAGCEEAVARLRAGKPPCRRPFAVMVRDLEQARRLCLLPPGAAEQLRAPEAPIVLLPRRRDAPLAGGVAPGAPDLGLMLPSTPLHHLLLFEVAGPLVAASGNLAEEPVCIDEREAVKRLGARAELFLVHDRPILRPVEESVVWLLRGRPRLLRRARGHAPLPVRVRRELPAILAVGAHADSTVAFARRTSVFLSQPLGELATPEALDAFGRAIEDLLRFYAARPVALAHDAHPHYLSTQWAREIDTPRLRDLPRIAVQHHHAHLAAILAEHGVEESVLGVIWDGAGYGADGTVWGGEFLLGAAHGFQRVAHIRPFRLPGGAAAAREPRRVAFELLFELYGAEALKREGLAPIEALTRDERRLLARLLERGENAPVTTSVGRLLDGFASLAGVSQRTGFESQAAMALEFVADPVVADAYPLPLEGTGPFLLDWRPAVDAAVRDLRRGSGPGVVSARFHNALVHGIVAVARAVGQPRVALGGRCFRNRLLTERAARRLEEAGFQVLLHRQVPPDDGGISLGQVMVAAARLREGGAYPW